MIMNIIYVGVLRVQKAQKMLNGNNRSLAFVNLGAGPAQLQGHVQSIFYRRGRWTLNAANLALVFSLKVYET